MENSDVSYKFLKRISHKNTLTEKAVGNRIIQTDEHESLNSVLHTVKFVKILTAQRFLFREQIQMPFQSLQFKDPKTLCVRIRVLTIQIELLDQKQNVKTCPQAFVYATQLNFPRKLLFHDSFDHSIDGLIGPLHGLSLFTELSIDSANN